MANLNPFTTSKTEIVKEAPTKEIEVPIVEIIETEKKQYLVGEEGSAVAVSVKEGTKVGSYNLKINSVFYGNLERKLAVAVYLENWQSP